MLTQGTKKKVTVTNGRLALEQPAPASNGLALNAVNSEVVFGDTSANLPTNLNLNTNSTAVYDFSNFGGVIPMTVFPKAFTGHTVTNDGGTAKYVYMGEKVTSFDFTTGATFAKNFEIAKPVNVTGVDLAIQAKGTFKDDVILASGSFDVKISSAAADVTFEKAFSVGTQT